MDHLPSDRVRARLAELVRARIDVLGISASEAAKQLGWPKNRLHRLLHPGEAPPSGPEYAAVQRLVDVENVLGWCHATWGDLDPPSAGEWSHVDAVIRELGGIDDLDRETVREVALRVYVAALARRSGQEAA